MKSGYIYEIQIEINIREGKMRSILRGIAMLVLLFAVSPASAFTSGSTGADGTFSPSSNMEVQLPEDGILNYTTVYIPPGITVTFRKNSNNTPVYIFATGDVTISGTIDVSGTNAATIYPGKGGPGAFDGGNGSGYGFGGHGLGPGGGEVSPYVTTNMGYHQGGGGGYATEGGRAYSVSGAGGKTYGNDRIIPMIGGSGGAGGNFYSTAYAGGAGGGGGGAILIASSGNIDVIGRIQANGGAGYGILSQISGGGGSGGAIKLIANRISGDGVISAVGGSGGYNITMANKGGNGRIRLEADVVTRTTNSTPYQTYSTPGPVFVADIPSIRITSIGGIPVPSSATGSYGTPDITLPSGTANPIQIELSASNIPTGTAITVSVVPQLGQASSSTSTALSGTRQSSTATASVNLTLDQPCVITAQTTFNVQTAMYYEGEKIEKAMVASVIGKGSEVTYITEKGRHVSARELMAKATMN